MKPIFGPPEGPFVLISGLLGESFWDSPGGSFWDSPGGSFWDRSGARFWCLPGPRFGSLRGQLNIRALNHQVLVGTRVDRTWTTTPNWATWTPEIESGGGPPWPAIYGGGAPTPTARRYLKENPKKCLGEKTASSSEFSSI